MDLETAAQRIIHGIQQSGPLAGASALAVACGETAIGKGVTVFVQTRPTIKSVASLQEFEYPHSTTFHVARVVEAARKLTAQGILAHTRSELVAMAHMGLERFKFLGVTTNIDRHTFYVPSHALERGGDWCDELNSVDWYAPDSGRYFLQICPTITLRPAVMLEETRELLVNLATGWNYAQTMSAQQREDHAEQLCAQMAQATVVQKYP